jgi:hypothetical protein
MTSKPQKIVAYLFKDEWLKASDVQAKRAIDRGAYDGAHPYTVRSLINRRDNGKDTPFWIDLDGRPPNR